MSKNEINENELFAKRTEEEKENLKKKTIERMMAGAKEEQKRFDELQQLRKNLKHHLQVNYKILLISE